MRMIEVPGSVFTTTFLYISLSMFGDGNSDFFPPLPVPPFPVLLLLFFFLLVTELMKTSSRVFFLMFSQSIGTPVVWDRSIIRWSASFGSPTWITAELPLVLKLASDPSFPSRLWKNLASPPPSVTSTVFFPPYSVFRFSTVSETNIFP